MIKTCTKCHISKPVIEFHKYKRSPDGYKPVCKECRVIESAKWWENNKEELKAKNNAKHAVKDKSKIFIKRVMRVYKVTEELAQWIWNQTHCEWCGIELTIGQGKAAKVVHHNHDTGEYVATLCSRCNLIEGLINSAAKGAGVSIAEFVEMLSKRIV